MGQPGRFVVQEYEKGAFKMLEIVDTVSSIVVIHPSFKLPRVMMEKMAEVMNDDMPEYIVNRLNEDGQLLLEAQRTN